MRGCFLLSLALTLALMALPVTAIAKERKVQVHEITITKHYDKSSAQLMRTSGGQQSQSGDPLRLNQATQTFAKRKGKKNTEKYMTIKMQDAPITSYRSSSSPSPKGPQQNLLEGNAGFSTNIPSGAGAPAGGGAAPAAPAGRFY